MKVKYLVAATALILASAPVYAGQYLEVAVEVDTVAMSASGSMSTARFSDNEIEFIGCGTTVFLNPDGSTYNFGFCQAATTDNVRGFCNSDNPGIVAQMGEASAYSYLSFNWDVDGICTRVKHSTQSFYIPEHLDGNPGRGH
ncbi:MAG: hypothetical protein IMF09_05145 [Proteobacteria bacterium]|nr:hypothetical protein [Pseudomonadota bacterium]